MKKFFLFLMMAVAIVAYAQEPAQGSCSDKPCCNTNQCDSLNIPVFIVDGVEVQDVDGIASDDILKIEVIKDPEIKKIFSPRLGGIVIITTKSKKFLKPIVEEYNKRTEEQKKNRIPGQLIIR